MAARKKSARKKVEVPVEDPGPISRTVSAIRTITVSRDEDPRPKAWRKALAAMALKEPCPRECRVHLDDRFTGKLEVAKVQALMIVGKTAEDAAELILAATMKDRQGEKNCPAV